MALGRPRKSDALHALHGTKPHPSTAKTESALTGALPQMPAHLTAAARREWRRVLPLLAARGSLTEADSAALALYCETHARWIVAKQDLEQNGLTVTTVVLDAGGNPISNRKPNPALKIAENCERALRGFLTELGLTPRSRERVVPARKPKAEGKSSFDSFIEANRK